MINGQQLTGPGVSKFASRATFLEFASVFVNQKEGAVCITEKKFIKLEHCGRSKALDLKVEFFALLAMFVEVKLLFLVLNI